MKKILFFIITSIFSTICFAQNIVSSTVTGDFKKIDEQHSKVFLKHNGIKEFEMPAMSMWFKYKPEQESFIKSLQDGDKVQFSITKDGSYILVEIKK